MKDLDNEQELLILRKMINESDNFLTIFNEGKFKERFSAEVYAAFKKEKFKDFNNFLSQAVYFGFNLNDKFGNGKDLYDLINEHSINNDFAFFEMLHSIKLFGDFDFNSERLLKSKNAEMIQAFNNPIQLTQKGKYHE